jgi:hypothetical protein
LLGIGAPKNTPVDILDKLNKEINAALADMAMKMGIENFGYSTLASSPAEFGKLIAEDIDKWGEGGQIRRHQARVIAKARSLRDVALWVRRLSCQPVPEWPLCS